MGVIVTDETQQLGLHRVEMGGTSLSTDMKKGAFRQRVYIWLVNWLSNLSTEDDSNRYQKKCRRIYSLNGLHRDLSHISFLNASDVDSYKLRHC